MTKPTGPMNPMLKRLIRELRSQSKAQKAKIWSTLAERLEGPRRSRPEVNLSHINRYAGEGGTVVVPGKVLAAGKVSQGVTVVSFRFSRSAAKKITSAGGKVMSIEKLMEENPTGKGVKLMV